MSVSKLFRTRLGALSALGVLIALTAGIIAITPYVIFPKVVKTVPDPTGRYVAEVLVRPNRKGAVPRFLTALDGMSVDISVRVQEAASGRPATAEVLLTEREDCIQDGEAVAVTWDDRGTARFTSRRDEMRLLSPSLSRIIQ